MDTPIYVVNYKNDERRQRMSARLTALGFQFKFADPVETSDSRLSDPDKNIPEGNKRVWAIMLQHLDSIRDFYENTTKNHCIVCEDDIYIKKSMPNILEAIIKKSEELNFDVVLLGYLMPYKIEMNTILHSQYYKIIDTDESIGHVYHKYPCDLWGSQMYMVSRENAKTLLEKYTVDYALTNIDTIQFNPDFTLTKDGNGAILYPMIAIEEGEPNAYYSESDTDYHRKCCSVHYIEGEFI